LFAFSVGIHRDQMRLRRQVFVQMPFDSFQSAIDFQLQGTDARQSLFHLLLFQERAADLFRE
jgi:hypothetical protein